jgi:hypothetical protein
MLKELAAKEPNRESVSINDSHGVAFGVLRGQCHVPGCICKSYTEETVEVYVIRLRPSLPPALPPSRPPALPPSRPPALLPALPSSHFSPPALLPSHPPALPPSGLLLFRPPAFPSTSFTFFSRQFKFFLRAFGVTVDTFPLPTKIWAWTRKW